MPLVLSGDGAVGPLSATEVSYLDGVTSAVQTQINGKLTTPGAWTDYTPTLTNVTVGNGTLRGRYTRIGNTVFYAASFTMGSTSSVTGAVQVSLPVSALTSINPGWQITMFDAGPTATDIFGVAWLNTADRIALYAMKVDGTYTNVVNMTGTVPVTWTTSDILFAFMMVYEAA